MKILIVLILLSCNKVAGAQKNPFRNYHYERTIAHSPEIEKYDSLGKKRFYIWRKPEVIAYPNPTEGWVYLTEFGDVTVSDLAGRVIKKENNRDEISLHGLSAGTYLITIKTEDNIYHHLEIKL